MSALPLTDLDRAILDQIERLLSVVGKSADTRKASAAAATYRNARTLTGRARHANRMERALRRAFEREEATDYAISEMGGPQAGGWMQNLMYEAFSASEYLCAEEGFRIKFGWDAVESLTEELDDYIAKMVRP